MRERGGERQEGSWEEEVGGKRGGGREEDVRRRGRKQERVRGDK